jgi:predicted phage baseplate assembly protein
MMTKTHCSPGCLCQCCVGTEPRTPRNVANPQGRPRLRYQVGQYGDFLRSMIAELGTITVRTEDLLQTDALLGGAFKGSAASQSHWPPNPLSALTTRLFDDPTMALLDAWSIVLHVLTFYNERIANEGYLRSATEFRSVLELARLVGYEPRPGVSATTYLAYQLENDHALTIRSGSKAQSVPESDQLPQTFETSIDLKAHFRWNNLTPRRARPQVFEPGQTTADKRVFFEGLNTLLKPNDPVLLVFDGSEGEPFRVKKIVPDNPNQRTMIVLQDFAATPLLAEPAAAVSTADRQLRGARKALELSDDYSAVAQDVRDALKTASATIDAALAGIDIQKIVDSFEKVRSVLADMLNDDRQSRPAVPHIAAEYRIAFDDFSVRLGMLADYLRIQIAAVTAASGGVLSAIDPTGLAGPDKDRLDALKAKWSSDYVKAISPVTLAGVFHETEQFLESLSTSATPGSEANKALSKTRLLLGGLVRSLLRGIIDRFSQPRQAGVLTDARLSALSGSILTELRNSFTSQGTTTSLKAGLVTAKNAIINLLKETTVFDPFRDLVIAVQDHTGADFSAIKTEAESVVKTIGDLNDFRTTFQQFLTGTVGVDMQAVKSAASGAGIEQFGKLFTVVTPLDDNLFCDAWQHMCFELSSLDAGHLCHRANTLASALAAALGGTGNPQSACDAFLTGCDDLLRVPRQIDDASSPPLVDDVALSVDDPTTNGVTIDSAAQCALLHEVLAKLVDAVTKLEPSAPAPDLLDISVGVLMAADSTRAQFAIATEAVREINHGIDELNANLLGSRYRTETFNNFLTLLERNADTINSKCPSFLRLRDAITFFRGKLGLPRTTPDVTSTELTLLKKIWLAASSGFVKILKDAEPLLKNVVGELVAKTPLNGLQSAMPRLRQVARLVDSGNYSRIGPWLNQLVESLDHFASDLTLKADPISDASSSSQPVDIAALSREPILSPAEMARFQHRLEPTPDTGPDTPIERKAMSDLAVQLAGELNPRLAGMVYDAIENAKPPRRRRFQAIHVLRATAFPFGYNAERQTKINTTTGAIEDVAEWPLDVTKAPQSLPASTPRHGKNVLLLNGPHDKVTPGSFVVIERTTEVVPAHELENPLVARVDAVTTVTAQGYRAAAMPVTQLTLDRPWLDKNDVTASANLGRIRNIVVYLQSEPIELAGEPYDADIGPIADGDADAARVIELDDVIPGLRAGQWIVVAGERTDVPGTTGILGSELALIAGTDQVVDAPNTSGQGRPHTILYLAQPLTHSYQRQTVAIYGNVVKADHGETKAEVLGSGDARVAGQTFELKQRPLTHLSAPTPSGAESTLKVRVNGILWHPAARGAELDSDDRQYVTQTDAEGKTTVRFAGARVPSGTDNVRAEYRVGTGRAGNVATGKITQLLSRPLGVKEVTNPLPATGGADREATDHARQNAPLGVTALDRLVSVSDYADFARTYSGVVKSYATRLSDGHVQRVHLTVAGQGGDEIPTSSDLYHNLVTALHQLGDPLLPLTVQNRRLRLIVFVARLKVHPDYEFDAVRHAARSRVLGQFRFERREFGQDVMFSELMATIQATPGIAGVVVDAFGTINERREDGPLKSLTEIDNDLSEIAKAEQISDRISIRRTRRTNYGIQPAEIAFFSPRVERTLILNELL